jgi:putative drug exporter of the RND superfamily
MPRRFLWVLVAGALIAWLGAAAVTGPFAGKLSQVQSNDQATFLPQSAESTRVAALEKKFDTGHTLPALIVLVRESGLEGRDLGWAEKLAAGLPGDPARPIRSRDGKALQIIVSVQEGGASGVGTRSRPFVTICSGTAPTA